MNLFTKQKQTHKENKLVDLQDGGGVKTWRSPSSPQIHQKYIYMWNNSYRTPTERWQKTSDFAKGKKLPTYLGKAKEKRKNRQNNRDRTCTSGREL